MYCCICKENKDVVYEMDKRSKSILGLNPCIPASICKHCIASANKHISIKNKILNIVDDICVVRDENKSFVKINMIFKHKDGPLYIVVDTWRKVLSNGVNVLIVEYVPILNPDKICVRTEEHFMDSFGKS